MLVGYRTLIVAGLQVATGVLAQTDWVSFLSNPKAGAVAIGSGILTAGLRYLTTTPIGKAS